MMDNASSCSFDLSAASAVVSRVVSYRRRRHRLTPEEAQDMRQDAFLAAVEASARYRPDGGASYSTWINRRAQGAAIESFVKGRTHGVTHDPRGAAMATGMQLGDCAELDWLAPDVDAMRVYDDQREEIEGVAAVLKARLPANHWEILSLHFGLDCETPQTFREIGDRLGVSHVTAQARLAKALAAAQEVLGETH